MDKHFLDRLVDEQKQGQPTGIASLCSAHPFVLQAAMLHARETNTQVLVESTCNQVNQFGGYTGMTPRSFVDFVQGIANENHIAIDQLLLGGDHLGPNVWQHENAVIAMQKSKELVRAYVQAGFTKIHLDASMKLADDAELSALPVEVSAGRAADLAQTAEQTWKDCCQGPAPRYIIGTEVPVPGGAQEHENGVQLTSADDAKETIEITRKAFQARGLEKAWERVIALVVQPGVEFGDDFVLEYKPEEVKTLVKFIEGEPNMVFEAHSTDYQTGQALSDLVRDHFAILKVGPALTFAFREAVFALASIENELQTHIRPMQRSQLLDVMDDVMVNLPEYWSKYYGGNEYDLRFARKFSLSDRVRYYWPDTRIQEALAKLMHNLDALDIPYSLLSQYVPQQYERIRSGQLKNTPHTIILDRIQDVLRTYQQACQSATLSERSGVE
ncbi:MAG: D-tagatose-bisphosphate aldolase, class II, non-catalytic subunit [Anaerolineaceae bacterium]|nr:D-tagatose-bisphosphate aldolase, class II, non-catalytic subunit [Anaerolineaceae bacterium]